VSNEGLPALYRGCGLSIIGIVPYAGIDLAVNSALREMAAEFYDGKGEEPSMAIPLACGMVASTTAMVSTYPIGLVRTKIQASGMPGAVVYSGPLDAVVKTLRQEGWRGLFRGMVPNLLKVVPAGALSAASYSVVTERLKKREKALSRSFTRDRITV
jgi:solute carrier family 25 phosphate transporter 23/24/25/41